MKINEVEAFSGISKKNIRFYEEQGLITPRRNPENGYREYDEADIAVLRRIRLLRKLDVPIEEIRKMFSGVHTVGDGMRRHLITLEREQRNLQQSMALCEDLSRLDIPITQLDTDELLGRMTQMEQTGTSFSDAGSTDILQRYTAPVAITAAVLLTVVGLSALLIWLVQIDPENAPPIWFLVALMLLLAAVGIGAVLALTQRFREIQKGEIDDAKKY